MTGDCVFCDRSQFEKRLVGETGDFWIIAGLGQISNGGYVLLVPKRHVSCIGALEPEEARLVGPAVEKIRGAVLREYVSLPSLIIFEHGIVGQTIKHAHLHFVPALCNITDRICRDFPQSAILRVMPDILGNQNDWEKVRQLYSIVRKPYLLWYDGYISLASGMKICLDPPAPLQYLRIVVADEAGCPERANWRTMDPELDKKLWIETVKRLKPYFL